MTPIAELSHIVKRTEDAFMEAFKDYIYLLDKLGYGTDFIETMIVNIMEEKSKGKIQLTR